MQVEKSKRREIIDQCLLWAGIIIGLNVLFYAPYLIKYGDTPYDWYLHSDPGLLIVFTAAPFIAIMHYYWLYEGYLAKKKYSAYLLRLIPFAVIIVLTNLVFRLPEFLMYMKSPWVNRVIIGGGTGAIGIVDIPFIVFYSAVMGANSFRKRSQKLEMARQKTAILLLKNQLEPHFLFNTLNAIYAIAQKERASKTLAGIEELAGLVRYATETADKERVSVADELKFTEQYLYLQEMSAGKNNTSNITYSINWDREPATISPMLVLPFATYAVNRGDENGAHTFNISIEKGVLHLIIEYPASDKPEKNESLANARKLLGIEYPNDYQFEEKKEGGNNMIIIDVNLGVPVSVNN